jgi:hypothetical protein
LHREILPQTAKQEVHFPFIISLFSKNVNTWARMWRRRNSSIYVFDLAKIVLSCGGEYVTIEPTEKNCVRRENKKFCQKGDERT